MNKKYNKQKIFWLIMMTRVSAILSAQDAPEESMSADSLSTEDEIVNLYFNEMNKNRLTGSVNAIDTDFEFARDSRLSIGSAINGKVPGLIGNYNTWGTGNAVIVIDGVPQSSFYYDWLNPMEVESIVILKDAVSKAMYGAMGDRGVILVNTKQGDVGSNKIRVSAVHHMVQPRAYPNYLNSADYMEKYNEARTNDGLSPIYSLDIIDMTRNGSNPALYPDEEFFTEDYLRNFRSNTNVFFDVSGGNQNAKYYVNTEWERDNGWLSTPIPEVYNSFNFRGNLNFKINDYMRIGVSGVARLTQSSSPNSMNYWSAFSSILPNAYPVLWDPNLITNPDTRNLVLENAVLHDGMILGGYSTYENNQVYGDLTQNGKVRYRQSLVQFTGNVDVDLGFITKGLSLKGFMGINFYNTLYSQQNYEYAIYEPVDTAGTDMIDTIYIHGTDIKRDQYSTNNGESTYNRQITYYSRLGYDRSYGMHAVSASALIYGSSLTTEGSFQDRTVLHYGLALNYMYRNRYVIEGSIMNIGTKKLPAGENTEPASSVGVAWIISEEGFMDNVSFVNLLKLKASYGISKNDDWGNNNTDYYRWANTFVRGGNFNYNNGGRNNNETEYSTVANDIYLQKREDLYAGLEAVIWNNALHFELGYFQSHSLDNLTEMQYLYPQVIGFENLVFANFNSDKTSGLELGIDFSYPISPDLTATIGGNLININPVITKRDEPFYEDEDKALLREGTATDAMWALVADGLYSDSDFNPDGSLVDGLPEPVWGGVQTGDIKYLDQNGDGTVDQLDQRIVGHGLRTQYSIYLDLHYRNFGLYVQGIGRIGDSNTRNSSSYFKVQGSMKYSDYAMQAYGPNNQNLNALNPRLTTLNGGNNDRNSSFWVYENNSFTLPIIQLTYHFDGGNALSFLKDSQVYVRGGNLVILGKNKKYTEVNPGQAPNTRSFVLGIVSSF